MTGSVACDCTSRFPVVAIETPSVCVEPCWNEFAPEVAPPTSKTFTIWTGPDESSPLSNARCTKPKVPLPLHGLLFFVVHVLPFHVPVVCSQSQLSVTWCPPEPPIGIPESSVHVIRPVP